MEKKKEALLAIEQSLRGVTDRLGMPIDDGILKTVVAFNAIGFITVQSCEGHADRGCCYPWVSLQMNEKEAFIRIITLLEAFYKTKTPAHCCRLLARPFRSSIRIEPFGAGIFRFDDEMIVPKTFDVALFAQNAKQEMAAFGDFLTDMFMREP